MWQKRCVGESLDTGWSDLLEEVPAPRHSESKSTRLDPKVAAFLDKLLSGRTPRVSRRHPAFREMVRLGMHGPLARILNEGERVIKSPAARFWPDALAIGWKRFQITMFAHMTRPRSEKQPEDTWALMTTAFVESLWFEQMGFSPAWCKHKNHWYLTDDCRRADCPEHRISGQQARWRKRHRDWRRGRARAGPKERGLV